MSKSVHYRLPDQLLEDAREYAKSNGVTVTDVIIQGLQAILQPVKSMPEPDHKKPIKQPKISVIKQVQPVVAAMLSSVHKRVTVQHHQCCKCPICKRQMPEIPDSWRIL